MKQRSGILLLAATLAVFTGCDFLDPTEVTNPTVTEADFVQTPNAAASWTRGVERQLAVAVNQVIMGAEVVSDNLFNNRTLFSKVFDTPEIESSDFDVTNIQRAVHQLREMADRGLNEVVPADENATAETRAQLHFLRGYASLLSGELFVALPGESGGPALEPAAHFQRAVDDFQQARSLSGSGDMQNAALLAIARAHYQAGNRGEAVAAASEIRNSVPDLIRHARFDNTDGPNNNMQFAIFDSGQDEFQPLPRLDFLFPKYYSRTAGAQSPVAILKGEEAFLILAEAAISQGDLGEARSILTELLDLVASRPAESINDTGQLRGRRGGTWIYPDSEGILVAASPDDEPRAGLVLTRSDGPVQVPVISGTSVSSDMLAGATDEESLLELLYLMRQEIFVVEGRRMTDLGIRFPVALDEALTNDNIQEGSPATQAQLPSFIPMNFGLDGFNYEDGDMLAVILHNMNRAIVQNRSSAAVAPFH
ncbi:MAG: hypothetical protein WEA09_00660 [Gemmatimonadota bacterium]